MSRFYGKVGYGESVEEPVGSDVWVDRIVERIYRGNVERNSRKLEDGDNNNDDISVGNTISILADAYAMAHFFDIKYIQWAGKLWRVSNVDVEAPRLILSLGKVYNGPTQ